MLQKFADKRDAGKYLAEALIDYEGIPDGLLLALPRGGVPVAYEVAKVLALPLDVLLVRKLGVPGHEEVAMGAIASGGVRVVNHDIVQQLFISPATLESVTHKEQQELQRRDQLYRNNLPAPAIAGKTVIIVDDGLATGATMKVAIEVLRQAKAAHIIVAVPVGAPDTCRELAALVDKVICLFSPEPFYSVGQWYIDFSQTSDKEVQQLLAHSTHQSNHEHTVQ